jgi:hypothetical protein
MYPQDKLSLISEACALTGNNIPAAADDGSDEWTCCSAAYEAGMEYMLDSHDWKQLTTVVTLNATGIAPTDSQFDSAFAKPPDCIHVIWVRINESGGTGGSNLPIVYQVLSNQIVANLFNQPPGVPPPPGTPIPIVTMKYVSSNIPIPGGQNPSQGDLGPFMLRTFMTALRSFVLAGIYRGLHDDPTEARAEEQAAMALLQQARTRSDQEQPKRAVFNQRITASRRVRRPFPPTPSGWGGTGVPG